MLDVELLVTEDGTSPFANWFEGLSADVADRVRVALLRMERGNLGDHKSVGQGVSEHRLHFGPGYRIYFGRDGQTLIVLLAGGSKRTQGRDIMAAQQLWKRYKQRKRRQPWH